MTRFTAVQVTVTPSDGDPPPPGPSFSGQWLTDAGTVVARYWSDMSGGRERVQWSVHPPVQLPLTQGPKDKLTQPELIQAVRDAAAAAGQPFDDDERVVLIMDDRSSSLGVTPTDEPILAAVDLDPALIMHETGHAFQYRAGNPGGHASAPTPFSTKEYADQTCVMGFEPGPGGSGRFAFQESLFDLYGPPGQPPDTSHSDVGPAMCPPMTARCGWLDEGNAAAVQNLTGVLPAARPLAPWTGAPPPGYAGPRPAVLTVDGHAPSGDRVYVSLRSPRTAWDRGFPQLGAQPGGAMVVAQERTASGSTLILGRCAAEPGQWMRLGRATLRVEVPEGTPDGALVRVVEDPWRNWTTLKAPTLTRVSRVAAVSRLGMIDLVVVGADLALHWIGFRQGMWDGSWTVLDGPPLRDTSAVALTSRSPDTMDLFVIDRDGIVQRRRFGPSGWLPGWERIEIGGLDGDSGLAACATGEQRVELFCTDDGGRVLHRTLEDGRPGDWRPLPPLRRARAVAAQILGGHTVQVHAVSEGPDDERLWSITGTDGQWQRWVSHGVVALPDRAGIAATARPAGQSVLAAASTPMRVESFVNGAWVAPPELVPGLQFGAFSSLAVVARDHVSIDVIAVGDDASLHVITRSPDPDQNPADRQKLRSYPAALISAGGRFVSCRDAWPLFPHGQVLADVYLLQEAERFVVHELEDAGDNQGTKTRVAIETSTGEFIRAWDGGGTLLTGDRRVVGPHEEFRLYRPGGVLVVLQSMTGHLWTAEGGGGGWVHCRGLSAGEWERFELVAL